MCLMDSCLMFSTVCMVGSNMRLMLWYVHCMAISKMCVGGQEPKVRPSAKYLQQHKFVVAPRPSLAAAALLPLIARSRDALQAMAAASDPPVAPPTSRCCFLPPTPKLCCVA